MKEYKNEIGEEDAENIENPESALQNNAKIERIKVLEPDQNKRLFSLKNMIMVLLIFCWLVPVLVLFITIYTSYQKGMIDKTRTLLEGELSNSAILISHNLDELVKASKKISYDKIIEKGWRQYREEKITEEAFYNLAVNELRSAFSYDPAYRLAMLYLTEDPMQRYPNTIKERENYTKEVEAEAKKIEQMDTPKVFFRIIDDKLYLIRNLYTVTGFEKYGVFILELDRNHVFRDVNRNAMYKLAFTLDGGNSVIYMDQNEPEKAKLLYQNILNQKSEDEQGRRSLAGGEYEGYFVERVERDYILNVTLIAEQNILYEELNQINILIFIIFLVLVPLIAFTAHFFAHQVTAPIQKMIEAYRQIRAGKLGVQLEPSWTGISNKEFSYLLVSFNRMSSKIKYLFDYAYNEQLARKDAQIMALQSQINPHFLNNTLEMMNWQARMAGDLNVSKMIESLSTLLNYSMDRSNQRLISLAEEIRCADAYFYIVSMRFGQRLAVEKEINEELLQIKVPQLILQPLLENAVKHGVEKIKRGTIWMKVYQKDDEIILQVQNTGLPMNEEDIIRVKRLLSGEIVVEEGADKHVSLGIRNINERIKLIYGEKYGLSIFQEGDITVAAITIPRV